MPRKTKTVPDAHIIALNSVGLSLSTIANRLGIHHTTVTGRLKQLGIAPADTRRAFMEEVFDSLSPHQREWLANQLIGGRPVKDFVKSLIIKEYVSNGNP